MPLFTRRKNESLLKRVFHAFAFAPESGVVKSQEAFQLELAKEISRSNRREQQREFSLIHFSGDTEGSQRSQAPGMLEAFQQRIRISDTLGWHSSNLALLLPETEREGAELVAKDLIQLAAAHDWHVESAVYVYPWDDKLISVSNEIAKSREGSDSDSDLGSGESNPVHDQTPSFADSFERVDSYHEQQFQGDQAAESSFGGHGASNGNGSHLGNGFDDGQGTERSTGSASVQVIERPVLSQVKETAHRSMHATSVADLSASVNSVATQRPALSPAMEARLNSVASSMSTSVVQVTWTPWWKRAIDIVGAGTGLVVLSPVLLVAAVAIKLSSPGPILFRQKREGLGGRQFDIFKFRTMDVDAEARQASLRDVSEQDGPAFKLKNDPRITKVGATLRKSCIDELPQLVNVLVGQMSLVGPRPLPVSESAACSPWQRVRLTVLPGLTCTWQARGGRNVSFDQWMRMDLDYIKNRGFVSDVRLIFETAFIAILQRGSV